MNALALGSTAAQAGQIGLGPGLVQKNQSGRVKAGLPTPPEAARAGDVWAILLAGPECLFLYVSPNFFKA